MPYHRILNDRYERQRYIENLRLQRAYEAKQQKANAKLQRELDAQAKAQMIAAKLLRQADDAVAG
jgi:hypothetical protein